MSKHVGGGHFLDLIILIVVKDKQNCKTKFNHFKDAAKKKTKQKNRTLQKDKAHTQYVQCIVTTHTHNTTLILVMLHIRISMEATIVQIKNNRFSTQAVHEFSLSLLHILFLSFSSPFSARKQQSRVTSTLNERQNEQQQQQQQLQHRTCTVNLCHFHT